MPDDWFQCLDRLNREYDHVILGRRRRVHDQAVNEALFRGHVRIHIRAWILRGKRSLIGEEGFVGVPLKTHRCQNAHSDLR